MLGDLELQLVQQLEAAEHQVRAQHAVPALEGDFLQALGRRATSFTLAGVLSNEDGTVGEELKKLREKFRQAEPVEFVADIFTAVRVDTVLIEEMSVRELAGKPERFEYAFTLREYIPAPAPEIEPPPPPPPAPTTSLIVTVIVDGQPGYDFSQVEVKVEGTQEDGNRLDRALTNRNGNVWEEATFPPGSYRVIAVGPDPVETGAVMANEAQAEILEGEREEVTITLTPGQRRNVAVALVVHYWFDKAFIEPCLRPVLREVAQRAAGGREKLLIVGHTDLTGSAQYNQALSERRARGVHAYLTFKNDPDAAVAEWNELRKTRTVGVTNTLNDTWGVREYQYMLQDLGFYTGNINERHDDATDEAVRAFQRSKGLDDDGIMGDQTWPLLIRDYLAQDSLSLDDSVFFPNARDGCDGGLVRWIGCGELDPVENTQDAWRPNRRTEMLFVIASEIPCDLPRPVTWDIRPDGTDAPEWCLGPGDINKPCCFLSRSAQASDKWLVQPAHPETVQVSGQITFDDGITPYANKHYALIAADGKFLHKKVQNGQEVEDKGEVPSGADRGRPIFMLTDDQGNFSHPVNTPVGVYILELPDLQPPELAREEEDPPSSARGNVVCLEIDPPATPGGTIPAQHVIVQPGPVPPAPVNPAITLGVPFVAVKKPHTNPPRVQVTLRSDSAFNGTGTLDRSGNTAAVRLFDAATGGNEITFNGTDNVFPGRGLAAGLQLFAEAGPAPSGAVGDYTLTLTLNPAAAATPVGPPATASLTAVLFTLDIGLSRPAPGVDPPLMSEADKINVGRHTQLGDPAFSHERTMIIVRQPTPAVPSTLELVPQNGRVQLFTQETPAGGQAALGTPQVIGGAGAVPAETRLFAEGASVSTAVRDTGFILRVRELGAEVDRVAITVCSAALTNNTAPFNTPVARVQIEGILNRELNPNAGTFALADLFGTQANSLFRARVDIPGVAGNTLIAVLVSSLANGTQIERQNVTLTRTTGNRFASLPLLAIPDAIPRNEITFANPQDIEVIRTRAGGRLRLEFDTLSGVAVHTVRVRGRVLQLCSITIQGAAPNINGNLTTANRVMAQNGTEFRLTTLPNVNNPVLLDIQRTTCPLTIGGDANRSAEETALFALGRAGCAANFIVYFIRSDSMGLNGCSAFPAGQPGVTVSDIASQYTFGHEIGHVLHLPHDGRANNLMTGAGTAGLPANPANVFLEQDQCTLMNNSGFLTFIE